MLPSNSTAVSSVVKCRRDRPRALSACLAEDVNTRILVCDEVLALITKFLEIKNASGSTKEKALYKDMNGPEAFILRLLKHRPLSFELATGKYRLKSGETGTDPEGFQNVGQETEAPPLTLARVLSFDEMAIASLVCVSVTTPFWDQRGEIQGIATACVGAHLERGAKHLEYAHMIVDPNQNTLDNGYGGSCDDKILRMWANFYGVPRDNFPVHSRELSLGWQDKYRYKCVSFGPEADPQASEDGDAVVLDTGVYKTRLRCIIVPVLEDANARAKAKAMKAYIHVTGLGSGFAIRPWDGQPKLIYDFGSDANRMLYLEAFLDVLYDSCHTHENIGTIQFSGFEAGKDPVAPLGGDAQVVAEGRPKRFEEFAEKGIKILFDDQKPSLTSLDQMLYVAIHDGNVNAYPGSYDAESASQDGSALNSPGPFLSSALALTQNPDLNPALSKNTSITKYKLFSDITICLRPVGLGHKRLCYLNSCNGELRLFYNFLGGDEVGIDNTCKSAMSVQCFHGCGHHPDKLSASAQLDEYNKVLTLREDLLKRMEVRE